MAEPFKIRPFRALILGALVAALVAPMVFASGTQEKSASAAPSKPVIWFTSVQGGKSPAEMPLFEDAVFKATGVHVNIIKPPSGQESQKLETMLATGEPLDIAYLNAGEFDKLYAQNHDIFAPLTTMIKASPVLSDPQVIPESEWQRITQTNGQIYAVFNKWEQGTMPIIRMDWLKKLNLPVPKTFDDYFNVLKAFTTEDPDGNGKNDTYGMAVGYTLYDMSGLFGAYGLPRGLVADTNGNLSSPWASDAAIPVYQWLRKVYAAGYLEPNFVTNNSANFRNLFMTDKAGMTWYWAAWVGLFNLQVHANNPSSPFDAEGIAPPAGPDGQRLLTAGSDGLMVIPSYSKNKENAFKVMEFWNSPKGNILSSIGIEGYDYNIVDGKYQLTQIGKEHSMDHGAPQPKSAKYVPPIPYPQGDEAAFKIIREYAKAQYATKYDSQWETITRSEAAKIILGQETAEQGVANMRQRLKEAGITGHPVEIIRS
jgi:putative aldouronate transport system substrate-binding protein